MNDLQCEYERLIAPIEHRMIRAVWRITRDPDDADTAFQEALLVVWKRWDRILKHPNPQALVLHITINAAHDVLRRKARQGRYFTQAPIPEEVPDASPSAVQQMCLAEQDAQIRDAISKLPGNQAVAMLMHAVEEMPYDEIAVALDCRESTVRKHVARARAKLRILLSHLLPQIQKEEGSHV